MARCELALTDGPLVASPVWTTVGRIISAKIRRGRRANEGTGQPGTAEVILDDPTRALDPTNPGSAWAASLTPMRQMRIVQPLADATSPVIFRGHVDDFTAVWRPMPQTTLTCVDLLGYYGTRRLVDAASWRAVVLADTPKAWYRLGGATGSAIVEDSSGNALHGEVKVGGVPRPAFVAVAGAVIADPNLAADMDKSGALPMSPSAVSIGANLSLEFFFRAEGAGDTNDLAITGVPISISGGSGLQQVVLTTNGRLELQQTNSPLGTTQRLLSGVNVTDAEWHHVVWTRATNAHKLTVDGTMVSGSFAAATPFTPAVVGIKTGLYEVDEVAWYTQTLTAARIAEHYRVARGRWGGQTGQRTGARITTCTDVLGAVAPVIATGVEDVGIPGHDGAAAILGESAAKHLAAVADVEGGRLYVTRAGTLTFAARDLLTPAAVAAYANDGTGLRFVHGQPSRRRVDLVNHAEYAREGGPTQVAESASSIAAHLRHDASARTGIYADDFDAAWAAARAVHAGKAPLTRLDQLVVNARIGATEETSCALREIGDVVSVHLTPPSGSALDLLCSVEGISHDLDTGRRWSVTYDLAPVIVPQTPAVSVIAAPDQPLTSGVYSRITPYYEWFDTGNAHSAKALPQSVTCRVAGDYLVTATITFSPVTAGALLAAVVVNGTTQAAATSLHNAGNYVTLCASAVCRLVAGDVVELYALQTSGLSSTALFSPPYSPVLSMVRL